MGSSSAPPPHTSFLHVAQRCRREIYFSTIKYFMMAEAGAVFLTRCDCSVCVVFTQRCFLGGGWRAAFPYPPPGSERAKSKCSDVNEWWLSFLPPPPCFFPNAVFLSAHSMVRLWRSLNAICDWRQMEVFESQGQLGGQSSHPAALNLHLFPAEGVAERTTHHLRAAPYVCRKQCYIY